MSRTEWILGGILAVLVVIVAGALLFFWAQNRPAVATPEEVVNNVTVERTVITALESYEVAQVTARSWAIDAQLITARASWNPGSRLEPEEVSWNFVFFAPGSRSTALIAVVNNRASLLSSRPVEQELFPGDASQWLIDSPAVVETIMAGGGRGFLLEQGADKVNLSLTLDTAGGPVWRGTFINPESLRTLIIRVDASSGEVIEVLQS